MRIGKLVTTAALAHLLVMSACKKNEENSTSPTTNNPGTYTGDILVQTPNLPATPFNYANVSLPNYLNTPPIAGQDNTPASNLITDAGATLGRVLFYDKNLSYNNAVACASCHLQSHGFSDPATFSKGFKNRNTARNSMGIINARYYPNGNFFWDERAATAEVQVLMPIQDHIEMGMNLDTLVNKLNRIAYYPALFQNAFGDKTITSEKVSKALAQFIRSIVSFNSKYDVGRANFPANQAPAQLGDFPNFTTQENRGKAIFFGPLGGCAPCHGTETFTAARAENNGLERNSVDSGVGRITGNQAEIGLFKVPSLKNIELTAPYMHDGRFATLEQVVEHYNSGVAAHPNLSPPLRVGGPNGNPKRLNLSTEDKAALVAFLKTLTDNTIAAEAKYSNPF